MTRRVLRHTIPVDDRWHDIELTGSVVHTDCKSPDFVEIWTTENLHIHTVSNGLGELISEDYEKTAERPRRMSFRVFATGQPIEDGFYVRTALALGGQLVWHLFARRLAEVEP